MARTDMEILNYWLQRNCDCRMRHTLLEWLPLESHENLLLNQERHENKNACIDSGSMFRRGNVLRRRC